LSGGGGGGGDTLYSTRMLKQGGESKGTVIGALTKQP
jgi:hypothetical protein